MLERGEVVADRVRSHNQPSTPTRESPEACRTQERRRHRSVPDLDAVAEDLRAHSRSQFRQFRGGLLRTERSERNSAPPQAGSDVEACKNAPLRSPVLIARQRHSANSLQLGRAQRPMLPLGSPARSQWRAADATQTTSKR